MWHAWERSETQIELWWGNLKKKDFLEDLGLGGGCGLIYLAWGRESGELWCKG
jgi:hypothetical protein